jgi:hypothetical protein
MVRKTYTCSEMIFPLLTQLAPPQNERFKELTNEINSIIRQPTTRERAEMIHGRSPCPTVCCASRGRSPRYSTLATVWHLEVFTGFMV